MNLSQKKVLNFALAPIEHVFPIGGSYASPSYKIANLSPEAASREACLVIVAHQAYICGHTIAHGWSNEGTYGIARPQQEPTRGCSMVGKTVLEIIRICIVNEESR